MHLGFQVRIAGVERTYVQRERPRQNQCIYFSNGVQVYSADRQNFEFGMFLLHLLFFGRWIMLPAQCAISGNSRLNLRLLVGFKLAFSLSLSFLGSKCEVEILC